MQTAMRKGAWATLLPQQGNIGEIERVTVIADHAKGLMYISSPRLYLHRSKCLHYREDCSISKSYLDSANPLSPAVTFLTSRLLQIVFAIYGSTGNQTATNISTIPSE